MGQTDPWLPSLSTHVYNDFLVPYTLPAAVEKNEKMTGGGEKKEDLCVSTTPCTPEMNGERVNTQSEYTSSRRVLRMRVETKK